MVLARTGRYSRDVEKLGQRLASKHRSALLELEIAELYTRHSPGLKRYASAIAAREEIQNDAVQETFLRYMVERRCGRNIENPKAWLFQTLRNFLLDRLKKASCRNEVTIGAGEALFPAVDAEDPVERSQAAQAVASARPPDQPHPNGQNGECGRVQSGGGFPGVGCLILHDRHERHYGWRPNHMVNPLTIKLLALDIDGVLTDGRVTLSPDGKEVKSLNFHDLDKVAALRRSGMPVVFVTGEDNGMVEAIKTRFDVPVIPGSKDKLAAVQRLVDDYQVSLSEICYVGDSDRDAPALAAVGLGLAPANATAAAKSAAHRVLRHTGGDGAAAEAITLIEQLHALGAAILKPNSAALSRTASPLINA